MFFTWHITHANNNEKELGSIMLAMCLIILGQYKIYDVEFLKFSISAAYLCYILKYTVAFKKNSM